MSLGSLSHHVIKRAPRSTYLVRKLFKNKTINCVWSNRKIDNYDVDHLIPWTLWRNNDLWNLLPTHPAINNKKRDNLPSHDLIGKQFDQIRKYWEIYTDKFPELFHKEIERSLGISAEESLTNVGKEAFQHTVFRIQITQIGSVWKY